MAEPGSFVPPETPSTQTQGSVAPVSSSSGTTRELEIPIGISEDDNPYGLEILHRPRAQSGKLVQIVFVQGLGGSKRGTWTHSKGKFWPMWLHEEPGLENVRVALFGYNANFNVLAPNTNLSIPTFANQLLYSMEQLSYRHGTVYICM